MKWTSETNAKLSKLWHSGIPEPEIRSALGITRGSLRGQCIRLNLQPRGRRPPIILANDHPAMQQTRTLFPNMVVDPDAPNVLKPGWYQPKLGAEVTKGAWKGMPIYSLSLEERKTCPRDCAVYSSCYGNGMSMAKRYRHGPELLAQLTEQLDALATAHKHGFVVRLHMLGDFYSVEYVNFWRGMLREYHHTLHIFGYTAWQVGTPIGDAIAQLRKDRGTRFAIRHSGAKTGFRTVVIDWPRERGDAIICPVETGRAKSCGTCSLCWATNKPIAFVRH